MTSSTPITPYTKMTVAPAPTEQAEVTVAVAALTAALAGIDTAHRRIRHRLGRDMGLSPTELTALFVIGSTPDCTPKQLGAELDLSTGAITALVDRLEKAGQVQRLAHPTDRRSQLLAFTPQGSKTLETIGGLYNSALEDVVRNSPCVFDGGVIDCLHHAATAIDGVTGVPAASPENT